jgi:hypothetical protein
MCGSMMPRCADHDLRPSVTDFVLDNSVTMRWCFDGGSHDYADRFSEVSAVLARAQIRGLLTASKVAEFFEDLATMKIVVDIESADRVLTDLYRPATLHRLTANGTGAAAESFHSNA